jgi:hypothetical protein
MITANWLRSIWNSTDSLSSVVTTANWGIAITLLLGCVLTAITIIAGNRKGDLLRTVDREREERISQAQATAELARTEQKRLELGVAQAHVEQEELRKQNLELQSRVEQERTARLQIEERMRPRRLSPQQRQAIRTALPPMPRGIHLMIFAILGEPETLQYAQDFIDVLRARGWEVNGPNQGAFAPTTPVGLIIQVRMATNSLAAILQNVARMVGIEISGQLVDTMPDDEVHFVVGVKP